MPAPCVRVNLRDLCARPGRYEHHLLVVARIGRTQLEIPTASEPLAFAHRNLSDEYVVVLPTGHAQIDRAPFRVFVSDRSTQADVLRLNHRVLDLVLHPFGFAHWPGRLRPPYTLADIPAGMRRTGLTLVFCANTITPPPADRRLGVTLGREPDAKRHGDADVPTLLADLTREPAAVMAQIADVALELVVDPVSIAPPLGGYVVVLDAAPAATHMVCDLVFLPAGATLDATGIRRALVMHSPSTTADPPPATWTTVPVSPLPPIEITGPGPLPVRLQNLAIDPLDDQRVRVSLDAVSRPVPRYWLARTLFRYALHDCRLGYIETYAGFFLDDTAGTHRLGLRDVGAVDATPTAVRDFVYAAYRGCAPPAYVEDLR